MIQRENNRYIPTCDICGATLPDEDNYWDAIDAKADAGWGRQKERGQWIDVCPECRDEKSEDAQ